MIWKCLPPTYFAHCSKIGCETSSMSSQNFNLCSSMRKKEDHSFLTITFFPWAAVFEFIVLVDAIWNKKITKEDTVIKLSLHLLINLVFRKADFGRFSSTHHPRTSLGLSVPTISPAIIRGTFCVSAHLLQGFPWRSPLYIIFLLHKRSHF